MKPVTETTHVEERYMYQCIVWGLVHNSLWEIDTLVKWMTSKLPHELSFIAYYIPEQ